MRAIHLSIHPTCASKPSAPATPTSSRSTRRKTPVPLVDELAAIPLSLWTGERQRHSRPPWPRRGRRTPGGRTPRRLGEIVQEIGTAVLGNGGEAGRIGGKAASVGGNAASVRAAVQPIGRSPLALGQWRLETGETPGRSGEKGPMRRRNPFRPSGAAAQAAWRWSASPWAAVYFYARSGAQCPPPAQGGSKGSLPLLPVGWVGGREKGRGDAGPTFYKAVPYTLGPGAYPLDRNARVPYTF
jgi:hypothetical protein